MEKLQQLAGKTVTISIHPILILVAMLGLPALELIVQQLSSR
jgi:hypothetical protein